MRVAIVEDDCKAAELLREYLEGGEVRVTAVFSSGEEALDRFADAADLPDAVLMDIGLPGISGIETTRVLKGRFPCLEVVVQTIFEDSATIVAAIKAGASGYVLKGSPREQYVGALAEVLRGGSFLSGRVARLVLKEFEAPAAAVGRDFGLTGREDEILTELVKGAAYKEIADRLGLSVHTVNNHIRKVYEKLHVHSRGEAAAKFTLPQASSPRRGA